MEEQTQHTEIKTAGEVQAKKQTWRANLQRNFRSFLFIVFLILAFCIYWFYFNVFSKGDRTGILIKISNKGNVFKTNEGEMWLSCRQMINPEKFYFSVKNDSISNQLKLLQDKCVQVSYIQYRAKLPWRGDTKYIVTGITLVQSDRSP